MARRRRRFGFVRGLFAFVVVVALLAVAADRALAWYFEQESERAIQDAGARGAQVTIHGFPFLTQLAADRLDHVTGRLDSGTFAGYTVGDVSVEAHDVVPQEPFVARSVRADGLLGLDSVERAMSQAIGIAVTVEQPREGADADDALALSMPVAGLELTAMVAPTAADGSTLAVDVRELSVGGVSIAVDELPGTVADSLSGVEVPLDLPEGVTLTGASVEPGGLRIELDGVDIALAELTATTGESGAASDGAAP